MSDKNIGSRKVVYVDEVLLDVSEGVYEPDEDSFMLVDYLVRLLEDSNGSKLIVDVGTGCGIVAIVSAKRGARVLATDISFEAIKCAKENTNRLKLTNYIEFIITDLISPIRRFSRADLIVMNPPYLPVDDEYDEILKESHTWCGGATGVEISKKLVEQVFLKNIIKVDRVVLIISTLACYEKLIEYVKSQGLSVTIKGRKKLPFFEELLLIEISK